MAVEASIILEFGEDVDVESVVVELDDGYSDNLDSEGNVKGSFSPSESPVIIIHHDSSVRIKDVLSTDGSVSKIGIDQKRIRTIDALFTTRDSEVNVGYNNPGSLSVVWKGNTTSLFLQKDGMLVATDYYDTFPCVCKASFEVLFKEQWQLTPPSLVLDADESYTIYIVIYIENVK